MFKVEAAFFVRLERSKWRLAPRFGCEVGPGVTTGRIVCEILLRGVCFRSKFRATKNAARVGSVFESDFGYHFLRVTDRRGQVFSACHVLMSPKIDPAALADMGSEMDT